MHYPCVGMAALNPLASGMKRLVVAWVCAVSTWISASESATEARVDHLRVSAMECFERGDPRSALALNRQAIKAARSLPETNWRVIENFDDAGLYYFSLGQWKRSAQHQAVAVLLACGTTESEAMFPTYLERLGQAFSRYRPGEDFDPIQADPRSLLLDVRLNVRSFFDLRRRYFMTHRLRSDSEGGRIRYRYKLRAGALTCPCAQTRTESLSP